MLNRRQLLAATTSGLATAGVLPGPQLSAWAQRANNAFSLHIGVNRANPAAYGGAITPLAGCVNDANAYREMAIESGFRKSHLMQDEEATIKEVSRYIFHAADYMQSGDIFFVSYAGHGTGVGDRSGDESDDRQDEAWCLHDGLLLDDYLYSLWAKFRPGVRLLVISDSCHAGTVARIQSAARALAADLGSAPSDSQTRSILPRGVDEEAIDASREYARRLARDGRVDVVAQQTFLQPRTISPQQAESAYARRADEYRWQQRTAAGANNPAAVRASGILLAACQDHQLSWEDSSGQPGGLYTAQVQRAFQARNDFEGYSLLNNHLTRQMPAYQTPNFFPFGEEQEEFFRQTPFTV